MLSCLPDQTSKASLTLQKWSSMRITYLQRMQSVRQGWLCWIGTPKVQLDGSPRPSLHFREASQLEIVSSFFMLHDDVKVIIASEPIFGPKSPFSILPPRTKARGEFKTRLRSREELFIELISKIDSKIWCYQVGFSFAARLGDSRSRSIGPISKDVRYPCNFAPF